MKKLVFELKDFSRDFMSHGLSKDLAVQQAQAKFDNWFKENIENAPVIYVRAGKNCGWLGSTDNLKGDTHKARLVDIQEIKKDCKHEPPKSYESTQRIFCVNCNIELVAEWKAAE